MNFYSKAAILSLLRESISGLISASNLVATTNWCVRLFFAYILEDANDTIDDDAIANNYVNLFRFFIEAGVLE
jgi:hypothetical protein